VDDAPYTGDLDMAAVATRSELAGLLRTVHLRADRPSLRSLEARTRHSASPLSKTAVAEMLKAARFPRRTVMVAFLQTCGVPDSTLGPWPRAWERVAARESRTPGEISHAGPRPRLRTPASGQELASDAPGPFPSGASQDHRPDRPSGSHAAAEQAAEPHGLKKEIARLTADNESLRLQLAAQAGTLAGADLSLIRQLAPAWFTARQAGDVSWGSRCGHCARRAA
jgi:hypothetical protein